MSEVLGVLIICICSDLFQIFAREKYSYEHRLGIGKDRETFREELLVQQQFKQTLVHYTVYVCVV